MLLDRHSDASIWNDAPTCDNGRLTSKVSLAAVCAPAAALRNSAAVCGWDNEQPANQIEHRAVALHHVDEITDGLLKHCLAQFVGEGRKASAIDAVVFLETAKIEPVAGELRR